MNNDTLILIERKTEHYRGYTISQYMQTLCIHKGRQGVWEVIDNGDESWQACRGWIDATYPALETYRGYTITPRNGWLVINDGAANVNWVSCESEGAAEFCTKWIDTDIAMRA